MSKRIPAFVAMLGIAAATACAAPTDVLDSSERRASTSAALEVGPSSVPYPARSVNGSLQPEWSGTIVDVMAADAWAQCGAHVGSAAQFATDGYQQYLESRITQATCPGAISQTLPTSAFNIIGCGTTVATCPSPMKQWARQRQVSSCNVDSSTGAPSVVQFFGNASTGHTLAPSSFSALSGGTSLTGSIAAAQKEVDIAEVNLCMAQRLRENVASSDSLFLRAEDLRQLLEVIRQRAQIAMVQYALLARTFTNPHDPNVSPTTPYQAFITLMHWSKQPEAETPQREMGEDLAAAVQLHIDTTRELAQLLARTASARVRRGGRPTSTAQEDFGAGGWRQRLLALLYGGNPMWNASPEIDLPKVAGPDEANALLTSADSVPWDAAWTEDGLATEWLWPNSLPPISPSQKYATTSTSDPHVRQLLALARNADALYLKELNADVTWTPPNTLAFRRIDVDYSAPQLWALVEAWLRTEECKKTNPSCTIAVDDPTIPAPGAYASSLLWKKYGIQPAHATMLVSTIADVAPALSESNPWMVMYSLIYPSVPSLLEVQGAMHVTGASRILTTAEVAARLPGQGTGTWYRLDPKFDVLPLGNPERAPLYTYAAPYFLPRSFDKLKGPSSQGFSHGNAVKRLGAISALTATRNLLDDSMGGATTSLKANYLAKVPRALAAIGGAIGERSITVQPATASAYLYGPCNELYGPGSNPRAFCPTVTHSTAGGAGTARWNISVRTDASDPFFDSAASLVIVPFQGGIESAAALDPSYSSFKGATRATLLQSTARVEVPLPAPTAIGTTAKQSDVTVDLPTVTNSLAVAGPGVGRAFTVLLKRTRPDNGETEYQLLAQRLVLSVDIQMRLINSGQGPVSIGLPVDGQFIAYGGVLGQMAARAWVTLAHDWSKPAYDGFDLPVDWIPPFDPSLLGGGAGDDAVAMYVRNARTAADEATNAVKNAIEELLKEQADDATLKTAQRRGTEIANLEQRALCGDAKPNCDTSTSDFTTDSYIPAPGCTTGYLCLAGKELRARAMPKTLRLARAVYEHRFDEAPPAFSDYAGGTLQKVLIEQWAMLRKVKALGTELHVGVESQQRQIATAEAELAYANAIRAYECSDSAMSNAYFGGYSRSVDSWDRYTTLDRIKKGYYPEPDDDTFQWSPALYIAQRLACFSAQYEMGPANARYAAVVSQAWGWMASQTTLLLNAAAGLQLAGAELAKTLQDTKLAKARAELETSLAADTLMTKFGTYRRYHSYDVWRARALLESTRRYAVAARRAIEGRYVIGLSEMRSDEPFVAAPATWADEIYEYDLAAPASVGLTAIPESGNGVYPNRLVDYVGNLERFVNGYAVARPTAVAQNDDELFHVSGPDARIDVVIGNVTQRVLSGDVAAWEFLCPYAADWVQHPGLDPMTPGAPISGVCGRVAPKRARVSFALDPWGRLSGDIADDPYTKRHNARWQRLAVNLVGTGVRDCSMATDPTGCYANAYLRYNLTHVGPVLVTNYDEQWRTLAVPFGRIEGAKALAAEQWLDPTGNGFSKPYVSNVARTEFAGRPVGGSYRLELEVTPDVRLDRIDRVQVLAGSSYWVKQ